MIISEQWLRDWVALDLSVEEVADVLTNAGLEVDGIDRLPGTVENLVVGEVLKVSKHPDADRLNLTVVNTGDQELEIVCGASNAREGLRVAVATVGAKLPNGMKIKQAKVRGVVSNGMLCSASELGLEDASDGILELDADAEIGQRVDEYLQMDDALIDIDLTPNRGDCLSVQGIARELRVLASGDYHPLDIQALDATSEETIAVEVIDADACPVYLARVVSGFDAQATTPLWMQERLRRSGVRPISLLVDITNYVMMELGQPMHAFDRAKLDQKIVVRQSEKGEKIVLLDESEAELDGDTLVIADANGPIAIAGVMGGLHSAIDDNTSEIVFESAHFTRKSAAGKARRYGLHTESSHRYERGVDPELPAKAIERASELLVEIAGGELGPVVQGGKADSVSAKPAVEIRLDRLQSLLGMQLEANEVEGILSRISHSVSSSNEVWDVQPPSYRFDIEREADLVEEVARVKGYDNIPTNIPRIAPRSITGSESNISLRQVRQALVARDYREAITYSFISPENQALFSNEEPVAVANPLADNMAVMRTSLLPGLLEALQFNVNRQRSRVRLFESGASYHRSVKGYVEKQRLAGAVCGSRFSPQWAQTASVQVDFYDLKADLEALLSLTTSKNPIIFKEFEHIALHPGQSCSLIRDASEVDSKAEEDSDETLGWMGRLHPSLEKKFGVSHVYVFELNLEFALKAELPSFATVSKFPSVTRDFSVLVNQDLAVAELMNVIQKTAGKALVKSEVFDIYEGQGIPESAKSVSFSLTFQHVDKTMTDEEVEQASNKVLAALSDEVGASLRS